MKIPTSVVSDLRPVGVFSEYSVSSTTKTDHHDIAEIFLKVALNTIALTLLVQYKNSKTRCTQCYKYSLVGQT